MTSSLEQFEFCAAAPAVGMSGEQISLTELHDTFQLIDVNKDGFISFEELRSACQNLHMPINEKKFHDLFQHHTHISFDEFRRIIEHFRPQTHDEYFQETFRAFDKNSDGFITAKEIKQTMHELGETLTDQQVKDMIETADSNGDGKLSIEEFRILFNSLTQFTSSSMTSSSLDEH